MTSRAYDILDPLAGGADTRVEVQPRSHASGGHVELSLRRRFETFLLEQRAALASFLRSRLPTEEDAQDAVQESMVRLMHYRDTEPPASWRPLLYRIAVNVAHDHARRARSRRAGGHVSYEESLHALACENPPQDERVAREQAAARLWEALMTLPARSQEIYVYNRIDGMSYTEIARHCGISTKAVGKHLARALILLRQRLGDADLDAL